MNVHHNKEELIAHVKRVASYSSWNTDDQDDAVAHTILAIQKEMDKGNEVGKPLCRESSQKQVH